MIRPTRLLLTVGAAALVVVATGCSTAGTSGAAGTRGAPATAATAATTTAPTATAAVVVATTTQATGTPTTGATSAPAPATRSTTSAPTGIPASLTGRWEVHGVLVDVRADGTGTMNARSCATGLPSCQVVSDLSVRPYFGGLQLTVRSTGTIDGQGERVPLPAGVDPAGTFQSVGDYSVIVPFTSRDWPYDVPLTTALQSHVYDWQLVHRGGHPSAATTPSTRILRDLEHWPAGARRSDFYGA